MKAAPVVTLPGSWSYILNLLLHLYEHCCALRGVLYIIITLHPQNNSKKQMSHFRNTEAKAQKDWLTDLKPHS